MDKIHIRDLSLRTFIGIYNHEKEQKQDIIINVTLGCDLKEAGKSDKIEDTVNYKDIKLNIVKLVENSRFNLIEKIAEDVAAISLQQTGVKWVKVVVDKPYALRFAKSVAVEIERTK